MTSENNHVPTPESLVERLRATAAWRVEPRPAGSAVVVDIDGVLSDASQRQHHLNNPQGRRDWKAFFGAVGHDAPLAGVPRLLDLLDASVTVVLLSARPAWVFDQTHEWLGRHGLRWDLLVVRHESDRSDAPEFKRTVVSELRTVGYDIEMAFDDDERIIEMYRAEGVRALYVHSGYYDRRG